MIHFVQNIHTERIPLGRAFNVEILNFFFPFAVSVVNIQRLGYF